jgi:RHS repeat-associated protein
MSRHLFSRTLSALVAISVLLSSASPLAPVAHASMPATRPVVPSTWSSAWDELAESVSVGAGRQQVHVPLSRGSRNGLLSSHGRKASPPVPDQAVGLPYPSVAATADRSPVSPWWGVQLPPSSDPLANIRALAPANYELNGPGAAHSSEGDEPAALLPTPAPLSDSQANPSVRPTGTNQDTAFTADPASLETGESIFTLYLPVVLRNFSEGSYAKITPQAGGVLISPDGQVTIVFAPGAVDGSAIGHYTDTTPRNLPPSLRAVGRTFDLAVQRDADNTPITFFPSEVVTYTVHNDEFDSWRTIYVVTPTVNITIGYDEADAAGLQEHRLRLHRQDPTSGAWRAMPTLVDTDQNLVQVSIERDGRYALLGWPAAQASIPSNRRQLAAAGSYTATQAHVVLDPDHGGSDPGGTVTDPPEFAADEKNYNLQVAYLVRDQLQACGVQFDMTREGDDTVSSQTRADMINNLDPDAATTLAFDIVNHVMGDSGTTGTGVAAWVDSSKPIQSTFGLQVTGRVHEFTSLQDRGLKNGSWIYVVANVDGTVTYTHAELAFMDNYYDRAIMDDSVGMGAIANGVFMAILDMLGGADICEPGFELPDPLSPEERAGLRNLGYQNWMRYRGDPANTSTGNPVQQFTDWQVPGLGGFDLLLQRTYNAQDDRDGLFGFGWSSLLDMSLRLANDGSVDVHYPDGSGVYFVADGGGYVPGQDGVFDTLTRNGPDLMLATPEQTFYHFEVVGSRGLLVSTRDRHDNAITLERDDDGRVAHIIDSTGREFNLTYDSEHIASIADPLGRTVQYDYDANGDLVAVTDTNGGVQQFEYTDHRMTGLIDPEDILYLQNIYDAEGRVTEQIDASGSHCYFNYDTEGQTLSADNLGNQTQDNYDDLFRVTETVDALGNSEQFVYDDDYNVIAYTDKRGHTWTYSYDDRGNLTGVECPTGCVTTYTYNETNDLTSVTDTLDRTTTYVWEDGNLARVERPDGTAYTYTYDSYGQMRTSTDPNGHTTHFSYDGHGNLIEVRSPLGCVTHYEYDVVGRMTSMTDGNGHTMHVEYDGNDNVTRITDPRGHYTDFEYDGNDCLVRMVDRRGGVWTYEYDENLKLVSETDPDGHTTTHAYDAMYNRTSTTDPRGNTTTFRYDALYRLVEVEDALGNVTRYEYDANGNLVEIVDALGQETALAYDELNRLVQVIDPLGGMTEYEYDGVGRLVRLVNPRGAETRYEYNDMDQLIRATDMLGGVIEYEYDDAGNLVAITDANGHTTHFRYDADDRLIEQEDPEGHVTTYEYDCVGNLAGLVDGLGNPTTFEYDENDNLIRVTDALGGETAYTYDEEDNRASVTDPNGNTTAFVYNLDGLLVQVIEAGGQVTDFEYDQAHNLTRLVNANGNATTFEYDELNRTILETDPLDHTTAYTYDPLGRLIDVIDANGVITRYEYDPLDQLTAVVQNYRPGLPADHETNVRTGYTYDAVGNLLTITDANGNVTTFGYDLLDRLIREVNPIGNTWQYEYDPVGNLIRRTDANGDVTGYTYDADDLLVSIGYPDGSGVTFAYDAAHNQVQMIDGLGTTLNTYDALSRPISSTNHLSQTVGYAYDPASNQTSVIYPDGRAVLYEYDANNRVSEVIDPDGNAFSAQYDATHNVTAILYPNQTHALMTYDTADRLVSVVNEQLDAEPISRTISSFVYTLDAVGNRVHADETYRWREPRTLSHDYVYDPLYRLVRSEDSEARLTEYAYDAVGNRLYMGSNYDPQRTPTDVDSYTVDYAYNAANQLLATDHSGFGVTAYTYDPNGNRIRREGPDVWTGNVQDILRTDYTYDYENRLTWVGNFRDPGNGTWQIDDETAMLYDGYERLFRRTYDKHQGGGGQKWTEYVYDGLDPIVEYVDPSPQYVNYYRGLGRILEMHEYKSQASPPGTARYFHHDGLGSVSALTNNDGQSAHTYRYWDYGMALDKNGRAADASNFTDPHNHYTYTGQEWEEHTWLYHFYAREYDPLVGVWLQQDPYRGQLDTPMTLHRYGYVGGNPITSYDVLGYKANQNSWKAAQEGYAVQRALNEVVSKNGSVRCNVRVYYNNKQSYYVPDYLAGIEFVDLKPNTPSGLRSGQVSINKYTSIGLEPGSFRIPSYVVTETGAVYDLKYVSPGIWGWSRASKLSQWAVRLTSSRAWRVGGKVLTVAGAAVSIYDVGSSIRQDWKEQGHFNIGNRSARAVGRNVGGWAGAWGGAKLGAMAGGAIGSVIPGVGTAAGGLVGGVVGGIIGGMAGSHLGEKAGSWIRSNVTRVKFW